MTMAGMTSTGHQTAELNAARARIMDLEQHVAELGKANHSLAAQILALQEAAPTRCRCLGSDDYCGCQGEPTAKADRCEDCRQPEPRHQSWCPQDEAVSAYAEKEGGI